MTISAALKRVPKAYDRCALMVECPFEYHAKWVKKGKRYVCKWRYRPLDHPRWSPWQEVVA